MSDRVEYIALSNGEITSKERNGSYARGKAAIRKILMPIQKKSNIGAWLFYL